MATGRIGVTPTLGTRWSKAPAGGTTSLSGLDDNSVSLVYSVGYEQVYRNGVLLSRGNDYTATTGNSITLIDATIAGDIIEVFANELVPLTDAISKGQFTAKGALLSATAASTPAVLAVGANDTVLTADSSTATGLKWATVAAGANWSLLNTGGTALTGATTITVSGISGADKIQVLVSGASSANSLAYMQLRFNSDSGSNYNHYGLRYESGEPDVRLVKSFDFGSFSEIYFGRMYNDASGTVSGGLTLTGGNSSGLKSFIYTGAGAASGGQSSQQAFSGQGVYTGTSTISSVSIISSTGNFDAGTIYVYTSA